jgi:hypothetical protein
MRWNLRLKITLKLLRFFEKPKPDSLTNEGLPEVENSTDFGGDDVAL